MKQMKLWKMLTLPFVLSFVVGCNSIGLTVPTSATSGSSSESTTNLTSETSDNTSSSGGSSDGTVFDISVNQDETLIASLKQVGDNYEITISGEGEAISYSRKELVPWKAYSQHINKVTIEEGIENIGNYYFYSVPLDVYYIPSTVSVIEVNSFKYESKIYSYSTTPIIVNGVENVYYYSETKPSTMGVYWHMVGEKPLVWDKYKMLFIGNSFTFFPTNNGYGETNPGVCALTKEIAKYIGIDLEIDFVVRGGHTLLQHSNETDVAGSVVHSKLNACSDYDYVVLQEQSTRAVDDYYSFSTAVSILTQKINSTQTNCKIYLYATWGFEAGLSLNSAFTSVSVMEGLLREAYHRCAEENGVNVSDAGKAYTYVYENYPDINLYWSDAKHQNYTGSYLSACVHVATIFNADVRETTFNGILDSATADTLKETAYEVVFGENL